LRLTLGYLLRVIAKSVEFCCNGLHGGQGLIGVALVRDELATDFRGAQARIEPVCAELGVRLALAIDNGLEIGQQMGQVIFRALAATEGEGIEAGEPTCQLAHAFADGHAAPRKLTFRAPLATRAQLFDGTGHKQPTSTALEGLGRIDKQRLEGVCELHGITSTVCSPGG
jgi:hypothetical protein